jgi:hypothetical protein
MVEYKAFVLLFGAVLMLVGLPMLLFGLMEYPSSPGIGSIILTMSIFMLLIGAFFIIILITQK